MHALKVQVICVLTTRHLAQDAHRHLKAFPRFFLFARVDVDSAQVSDGQCGVPVVV